MIGVMQRLRDQEFRRQLRLSPEYDRFREHLLKKWKQEGAAPLHELLFSEFSLFFSTGNRTVYEKSYFERRRALNLSALLSIVYPDEPSYLRRLEDVIFSICNEYTWCLPAHQPTASEILADHLDLFATETGFALSEISTILGDRLSPLIGARIRAEVERRIITPYTDGRTFGWETSKYNWAAVCVAGVAASVIYLFPERFDELFSRFDATVRSFLSGFGEDGICLEGIGYWSYGFGFFTCFADLVYDFTDGKIDYFALPKVDEIARYLQKVFLCEDCTVSFSDGQRTSGFNVGILHYLHRRFGESVEVLPHYDYSLAEGCARWCLDLRKLLWFDPSLKPKKLEQSFSYYASDAEWFIKKTPLYSIAAKGGSNAEPHNHNDVGSFIVAQNGGQVFADFGSGVYTKQYFQSETRYEHLNCSSLGHSVAFFGEHKQGYGPEFKAKVLSADADTFTLELADAYRIPSLRSYTRSICTTDSSITLTDTFDADGDLPITERFLLRIRPRFEKDGIRIGEMRIKLPDVTQKVKVTEYTFEKNGKCDFWFIDIPLAPETKSFEMTLEICGE